jgi:hypothetical protein
MDFQHSPFMYSKLFFDEHYWDQSFLHHYYTSLIALFIPGFDNLD